MRETDIGYTADIFARLQRLQRSLRTSEAELRGLAEFAQFVTAQCLGQRETIDVIPVRAKALELGLMLEMGGNVSA